MLKTILLFIHLGSFALSFGLTLFCDLAMIKVPFTGKIRPREWQLVHQASRYIFKSLALLIASGIGFLIYYYFKNPAALANPKIYAKMLIVLILSANGYWLHKKGLSYLARGRREGGLTTPANRVYLQRLLFSGSVSAVSWWSAFILGTFRELNFVASFLLILAAYLLVLGAAVLVIQVFLSARKFSDTYPHLRRWSQAKKIFAGLPLLPVKLKSLL